PLAFVAIELQAGEEGVVVGAGAAGEVSAQLSAIRLIAGSRADGVELGVDVAAVKANAERGVAVSIEADERGTHAEVEAGRVAVGFGPAADTHADQPRVVPSGGPPGELHFAVGLTAYSDDVTLARLADHVVHGPAVVAGAAVVADRLKLLREGVEEE